MGTDLSVVIITVGRLSLLRAVSSVFRQRFEGNIQILIGLDVDAFGRAESLRKTVLEMCPPNMSVTWLDPGYSTSKKNGGVHLCAYGGSLRTAITFLARAKHVMYLDDDDWLGETHCAETMRAIQDAPWAFAYSYYADGNLGEPLCVDLLESVGVDRGIYREKFGGFVRPSGLLINKLMMPQILHLWAESPFQGGDGEDRLIFQQLKGMKHGFTGNASAFYSLDPKDGMHAVRLDYIRRQGKEFISDAKQESMR